MMHRADHDQTALLAQLDALESAAIETVCADLIRAGLQALIEAEAPREGRRLSLRALLGPGHSPQSAPCELVSTTSADIEVNVSPRSAKAPSVQHYSWITHA